MLFNKLTPLYTCLIVSIFDFFKRFLNKCSQLFLHPLPEQRTEPRGKGDQNGHQVRNGFCVLDSGACRGFQNNRGSNFFRARGAQNFSKHPTYFLNFTGALTNISPFLRAEKVSAPVGVTTRGAKDRCNSAAKNRASANPWWLEFSCLFVFLRFFAAYVILYLNCK